jgi:WbqC-like protein family
MKVAAIHQPNYLPWLGYFYKIQQADVFILLDDVDFQTGNASSITNRTKLKGANGEFLLTVPVLTPSESRQILHLKIDNRQNWRKKHLHSLRSAYGRSHHFLEVFPLIEEAFSQNFDCLADLNITLIEAITVYLGINTPLVRSSQIEGISSRKNQRLIDLCQRVGANVYLSGNGARNYIEEDLFEVSKIQLIYTDFVAPVYDQLHGEFVTNLSVVDCLFNCGRDALGVLTNATNVRETEHQLDKQYRSIVDSDWSRLTSISSLCLH